MRSSSRRAAPARGELVARLAGDLSRYTSPRLHLLIIVICAGGAAFLASVLLLWSGIPAFERMPIRYPAAASCGYLAFVLLIRLWISMHRPGRDSDLNALDLIDPGVADVPLPRIGRPSGTSMFEGGRSGGGGASHAWGSDGELSPDRTAGFSLDLDDMLWVAIALACALGGVLAVGYVVYMAPVLLAEVALDAAIVSAVYRRLRHEETGYWLTTLLSRTWMPALVLIAFLAATGFALQQAAPEARSIGAVIASLTN